MPHHIPWNVQVTDHPGSSQQELESEPAWTGTNDHHIGFRNRHDRRPGLTHITDDDLEESLSKSEEEYQKLKKAEAAGELVNFRDVVEQQADLHLRKPANRPLGWRYVIQNSEDNIKNNKNWPANIEKRKHEAEAEKKQARKDSAQNSSDDESQPEHNSKRQQGDRGAHHDAYSDKAHTRDEQQADKVSDTNARRGSEIGGKQGNSSHDPSPRYTPQETALLKALQHEKDYINNLQINDGKRKSPQKHNRIAISIDEADQFSPDNWLPRSSDLIRLTGKHPLNAEAHLSHLYDAGLITPNELHYVRNHGAVPRILWEFHTLDVESGTLTLSMDDLKNDFKAINIPIALACDGNRRKELNMIKRSKGFNWGSGAVSCAYWKGPLLRDVLLAAGVQNSLGSSNTRRWVNFQGADNPSEGKYETSVPLDYVMDPINDVMLAYEMNDLPLPPDHGYPVRLMIPGYVGGRCVKWLHKIWISQEENISYYHIWDNRVLPSFVTDKDGAFAKTLFAHPDTACNEQNLNSVIVKPAHGEKIPVDQALKGKTYRIEGYAYDGGGHEVQRVEVSLDGGETWLYCIRRFPDYPIRHGKKFWTWLHWHVDVGMTHLLQAHSISVRAFNVFKNTQPEKPSWNIMGMMNNCWHVVKSRIVTDKDSDVPQIEFQHPVEPGTDDGGWMQPSTEVQLNNAKQQAGTPQKQFTREEIEKHGTKDDCWIVVDGKVYDATSVLFWHPGGAAAILNHAGKVHAETSNEFASIHDDYAYQKLQECILGSVTEKAMNFIKQDAEAAARERAQPKDRDDKVVLQKHRWVPVKLLKKKSLSKDTRTYTFKLPDSKAYLGLGTCQHVQLGFHFQDRMLIRSYTPTRPLLPSPSGQGEQEPGAGTEHESHDSVVDGDGIFDLTVKTYFPSENQPGGAMSNILDCIPIGEEVELRGPTGEIVYHGHGKFTINGDDRKFKRVSMVLGGSGITPGYALIARIILLKGDETQVAVVDANKSEADILLHDSLNEFEKQGQGQLKVEHVLSHPSDEWKGKKGHINAGLIKATLFEPDQDSVVFLCGPPAMIQKAALPALEGWGYEQDKNMFGF